MDGLVPPFGPRPIAPWPTSTEGDTGRPSQTQWIKFLWAHVPVHAAGGDAFRVEKHLRNERNLLDYNDWVSRQNAENAGNTENAAGTRRAEDISEIGDIGDTENIADIADTEDIDDIDVIVDPLTPHRRWYASPAWHNASIEERRDVLDTLDHCVEVLKPSTRAGHTFTRRQDPCSNFWGVVFIWCLLTASMIFGSFTVVDVISKGSGSGSTSSDISSASGGAADFDFVLRFIALVATLVIWCIVIYLTCTAGSPDRDLNFGHFFAGGLCCCCGCGPYGRKSHNAQLEKAQAAWDKANRHYKFFFGSPPAAESRSD